MPAVILATMRHCKDDFVYDILRHFDYLIKGNFFTLDAEGNYRYTGDVVDRGSLLGLIGMIVGSLRFTELTQEIWHL